jgi:hypothetical protein
MTSGISEHYVIGLDDTDGEGVEGTGALARALAAHIQDSGWGRSTGVTRHQLWQSEKVAFTTGNHCYAVGIETDRNALDLEDDLVEWVRKAAAKNADPGVAIMSRHSDMPHVLAFGRRCQTELMRVDWAQTFSTESNVALRALGRKRLGAIGALAAVGLRGGGKDGRFIDLPSIRDLNGRVTAGNIRERTGVETVIDASGEPLDRDDLVETFGWLRPRLEDGKPVIHTVRSPEGRWWLLADRAPGTEPAGD